MTTDYRAELECLVKAYDDHGGRWPDDDVQALYQAVQKARAALSAPEHGPTDEEIMELMPEQLWKDLATVSRLAAHGAGPDVGPGLFRVTLNTGIVEHCRAVLPRWGRPAIKPVPVAERLPGPEDCDDQGRCWLLHPLEAGYQDWTLRAHRFFLDERSHTASGHHDPGLMKITHWLPYWALPMPQEGADGQH